MIYSSYANNELSKIRNQFEELKHEGDVASIRDLLCDVSNIGTMKVSSNESIQKQVQDLTYEIDSYLSDMEDCKSY